MRLTHTSHVASYHYTKALRANLIEDVETTAHNLFFKIWFFSNMFIPRDKRLPLNICRIEMHNGSAIIFHIAVQQANTWYKMTQLFARKARSTR